MAQIRYKDMSDIRKKHKNDRIVFASGCFDLTHAGHALFFEDCKKHGDVLVVLIGSDKEVKKFKGAARPVLNEAQRLKMVDSLRAVDYTFLDELIPENAHPLQYVGEVVAKLKPDVYVVNEDASDLPYRKEFSKKHDVDIVILDRWAPPEFEKISTSGIIAKIKKES